MPVMPSAPLFVRIAGLPAASMESFHSDACAEATRRGHAIRAELGALRAAMAEAIFGIVRGAPAELRGLLIEIKRDCHNARPLGRRARSPQWPGVRELLGPACDRVLALEEEEARALAALGEAYEAQAAREREAIGRLSADRAFLRGVTLSSPSLVENLPRLGRDLRDKRHARLEAALVRFASRAALKTSPFSTLTRLGLGVVVPEVPSASALRLVGEPWEERSLVRYKRYLLDQDYALLSQHPPLRDRLRVALNGSLWEPSPGRFCLVRPGFWSPQEGAMKFTPASLVQLDLGGPMIAWLLRELPSARPSHAELVATLEATFGAGRVRETLAKLLQIGFLRLLPPWPTSEGHLEARMLEELGALGDDPQIAAFTGELERLLALERGYPESERPLASFQGMERLVGALWETSKKVLGESAVSRYAHATSALYEDVFLSGGEAEPWRPILTLSRGAADEIARAGRPLARLAQLFDRRHEFLLAASAFARQKWPGRERVGLVEVMRDIQPLWRGYTRFLADAGRLVGASARAAVFDPFGLPEARALAELRGEVHGELERLVAHGEDESVLAVEALEALVARIPARHGPLGEACLMLQPAGEGRWALNQLFEGTGRYGSRYTPVMPEAARQAYTAHLAARSTLAWPGGEAALLDVVSTSGETLNVHAAQTAFVLELPDESLEVPAPRKLALADLFVRFDDPAGPLVVDGSGRAFVPVHLGIAAQTFMPFAVRLLCLFGPGELRAPALPRRPREQGEVKIWPRLALGPLVVRRKRWAFPASALPVELGRASKRDAFGAMNRFRIERGIPERVFVIERIREGLSKPQYVDFTSPSLVSLFASIACADPAAMVELEEMLPTPEAAPVDRAGQRWVVELQLDTLALGAGEAT